MLPENIWTKLCILQSPQHVAQKQLQKIQGSSFFTGAETEGSDLNLELQDASAAVMSDKKM